MTDEILGPFLILDTVASARMHLAALFVATDGVSVPPVFSGGRAHRPEPLCIVGKSVVHRVRFSVPDCLPGSYDWNDTRFELAGDLTGDLRLAFASCNGEEKGDLNRDPEERNVMWARLCDRHRKAPFHFLLHGGDQIYADEATKGHPLSDGWPQDTPGAADQANLRDLRQHLRERFFARYTALLADRHFAWLCARVPSLAQWDDHDICDGWGSLAPSRTGSPVGQTLFAVAREMALLFQHAAVEGDLPARFDDPAGAHLGWTVDAPGLRLMAPDLRSERTRRDVMGAGGWGFVEKIAALPSPKRTLILSSVPLLGPRLSLLETFMMLIPKMQKYEDDLRDQWQSRAHRASWQRMLRLVLDLIKEPGSEVTILSGEIHLATRAMMEAGEGHRLHQLVASGIAHRPPPQNWARFLGLLASLGTSPLPGHPVAIHPIPGQSQRYIAQRNALILTRRGGAWQAEWDLEHEGLSPPLPL